MRRVLLVSLSVVALLVGAGRAQAQSDNGSIIVAEGFSAPNAYSGPLPDVFTAWCPQIGIDCVPTVQLEVFDVKKSRRLGTIYAWGREFVQAGATLAFKEFILYDLEGGQLYTLSQDGGHPGGAFADAGLIPPKAGVVVLVGGAEGTVVGGTGRFAHASGGYSTRLKVESDGTNFIYYDELYIRFRQVKVD